MVVAGELGVLAGHESGKVPGPRLALLLELPQSPVVGFHLGREGCRRGREEEGEGGGRVGVSQEELEDTPPAP